MGTISLLVRVALACVFAVSGVAKLLDRAGTKQAVSGFAVPARLVPFVTAVLAPLELVTAGLLVIPRTATAGLVVALAMLAGFTAAVLVSLRAGRQVECHCFGRIGGADISWRTVARNSVLAALAVVGLAASGGEDPAAVIAILGGILLAAAVVAVEGWAGRRARLRKEQADEATFEAGMAADPAEAIAAPLFQLPLLSGGEVDLRTLLAEGRPVLIVFMSPGCGPCQAMKPAVERWADAYSDRLSVLVVSRYTLEANAGSFADVPRLDVAIDEDASAAASFGVVGTPTAVLVDPDGRVRGGSAAGERLVRRLLAAALSGEAPDLHPATEQPDSGAPADSIDLDSIVTAKPTVTRHETDGAVILVDETTGAGASLDAIGGLVWSLVDGVSPLREIIVDLAEAFGTTEDVVGPDVVAMVRKMGANGLLEGIAAAPTRDDVEPVDDAAVSV